MTAYQQDRSNLQRYTDNGDGTSSFAVVNPDGTFITGGSGTGGLTNAQLRASPVPVSGTVVVDESTLATSANQTNGNQVVKGNKTTNNAVPGATNLGTLPAVANAAAPTNTEGNQVALSEDLSGNQRTTLGTLISGEDQTNNVLKVEGQFLYKRVTADGQIKASAGFVHAITISPTTATPTAGLLTLYDNTAESGTAIFTEWFFATDAAHTIILDVLCPTGIFVGYDASLTNVSVTVSYR